MSTTPETPAPAATTEDSTVAILSYLTPIGFIIAIVMHGSKKTKLGSYHLRQSLGLLLTFIASWPISMALVFIPFLGWACNLVIMFGLLAIWVMGLIAAASGQQKPVPLLGEQYQKWFANAFN